MPKIRALQEDTPSCFYKGMSNSFVLEFQAREPLTKVGDKEPRSYLKQNCKNSFLSNSRI